MQLQYGAPAPGRGGGGYAPLPAEEPRGRADSGKMHNSVVPANSHGPSSLAPLRATEALAALLSAPEETVLWALEVLALARPGVFGRAVAAAAIAQEEKAAAAAAFGGERDSHRRSGGGRGHSKSRDRGLQGGHHVDVPKPLNQIKGNSSSLSLSPTSDGPVVQFSTFVYYCSEDESTTKLQVMRIGDLTRRSEVSFRTVDVSAKAGLVYTGVACRVVFAPEEDMQTVEVPLIDNDLWEPTVEFAVELYGGELGLVNTVLGRYLWTARVKLMDNDTFPSNTFEEEIKNDELEDVSKLSLFVEYFRFNWSNPQVRERSIRCIMIDQLHNLFGFFHLFVNVYLVDYVLDPKSPVDNLIVVDTRGGSLILIVFITIFPFLILHVLDHVRHLRYGLGGQSRMKLQLALMRKFLNYDEGARMRRRNGALIMAVTRDCPTLVSDGYIDVLVVLKELGELALMLLYQFMAPVIFHKKFSFLGFIPLFSFPILMFIFDKARNATTSSVLEKRDDAHDCLVDSVEETVNNFRLIADYDQREKFAKRFELAIKDFNGANRDAGTVLGNNEYYARWLSVIILMGWNVVGGSKCLNGALSLGMFLANVNIFAKIGAAWGSIYKTFLKIQTTFPALENIVVAMNLPTDVPTQKILNRRRRAQALSLQALLRADGGSSRLPVDRMPIKVGDLEFKYDTRSPTGGRCQSALNLKGMLEVQQGQLVCLIGPSGGGKSTLLRLLGGAILPVAEESEEEEKVGPTGEGSVFVPPHLRMLHVSGPLFFEGTLLANLVFGVSAGDIDERTGRVVEVCRMLGVEDKILKHIEDAELVETTHIWSNIFSATQCQLLCVARALIANPEVLCIHKPTQAFDEAATKKITKVLRQFVDCKGLLEQGLASRRRPRTCIITTSDPDNLQNADQIFHIGLQNGIRSMTSEQAIQALVGDILSSEAGSARCLDPGSVRAQDPSSVRDAPGRLPQQRARSQDAAPDVGAGPEPARRSRPEDNGRYEPGYPGDGRRHGESRGQGPHGGHRRGHSGNPHGSGHSGNPHGKTHSGGHGHGGRSESASRRRDDGYGQRGDRDEYRGYESPRRRGNDDVRTVAIASRR